MSDEEKESPPKRSRRPKIKAHRGGKKPAPVTSVFGEEVVVEEDDSFERHQPIFEVRIGLYSLRRIGTKNVDKLLVALNTMKELVESYLKQGKRTPPVG